MWGISKTRQRFLPGRPLLRSKALAPVRRLKDRILRRRRDAIAAPATIRAPAFVSSGRGHVIVNWEGLADAEALERLKEIADRHGEEIARMFIEIGEERRERTEQARIERSERLADKEDLSAKIRLAAAGGLTIETWGATFLAIGIGLTIWGVWIG